jgi:hypothetical protein
VRARRTCLLLALGVGLALTGCGPSVDPRPSGSAPVVVRPSLPSVASGISQAGVPELINVGIANGVVTGASGPVAIAQNTPVRLTVLSDTAETLLVSGYELRAQLTVGEPVQLAFIADRTGRYEVVLEESGTVLTTLQVG